MSCNVEAVPEVPEASVEKVVAEESNVAEGENETTASSVHESTPQDLDSPAEAEGSAKSSGDNKEDVVAADAEPEAKTTAECKEGDIEKSPAALQKKRSAAEVESEVSASPAVVASEQSLKKQKTQDIEVAAGGEAAVAIEKPAEKEAAEAATKEP